MNKENVDSINGDERDLALILLMAFRYAHKNERNLSDISKILIDNFHLLPNDFLKQFVDDIIFQYRCCNIHENVINPSFLEGFLQQCLKELKRRGNPYIDYRHDSLDMCPNKRGLQ